MKSPTLREIAAACRVNVSTVSRAIANHHNIPARTRLRILSQARKLGWRPNPLASAYMAHLRSTRQPRPQGNIAFLVSYTGIRRFADLPPYHQEVFAGAMTRAAAMGYSLETVWLRDVAFDMARLSRVLTNRGVLGVILHRGDLPGHAFEEFDCSAFAVATWGFSIGKPDVHRAAYHTAHGIRLALSIMRKQGYGRIALVQARYLDELADHAAPSTFLFEQRSHGAAGLLNIFDSRRPDHFGNIQKWLRLKRPEAVIGEQIAWDAIRGMNWQIPDDVAFVSASWGAGRPRIAGIDHRPRLIGGNVVDLLTTQIVSNERGVPEIPKLLLNEGKWHDGPSLPLRSPSSTCPE